MRELSLFTGAGGGIYGTKLLGWNCVGYVEWNDHCQRAIRQRIDDGIFDDAPIFGDIGAFISEGYARAYSGLVDVITAGFPCQPFSKCGKHQGAEDERNKWPETFDAIRIIRPRFALLENVPGLLAHEYARTIFADLAAIGYMYRWGVFSAAASGAPHKRERLFILASDAERNRLERDLHRGNLAAQESGIKPRGEASRAPVEGPWADPPEPGILRMDDGVAYWRERIQACGNGQVPAVVARAWRTLRESINARH